MPDTNVESLLRDAIAARLSVTLRYAGDSGTARTIHPHALFRSATEKLCVSAYQLSGYTSRGTLPQWKDLDLSKITEPSTGNDVFEIEPDFDPSGHKYRNGLIAYVRP